jgi:hypothetical protein
MPRSEAVDDAWLALAAWNAAAFARDPDAGDPPLPGVWASELYERR